MILLKKINQYEILIQEEDKDKIIRVVKKILMEKLLAEKILVDQDSEVIQIVLVLLFDFHRINELVFLNQLMHSANEIEMFRIVVRKFVILYETTTY